MEGTHSYYEWQLSTLLLAYDTIDPLSRDDLEAQSRRQEAVERELYELVHATLPDSYKKNPSVEFTPEVVIELTRATLRRAAEIARILPPSP